jgi:putative transposase
MMRDLGRSYVGYFNRRHDRSGTLWEGRFRHIELNPVRAGMVKQPSAYPWSSHAVNTGAGADPMVRPHSEFTALATNPANVHASYRGLFEQAFDETMNGGYPLVSEAFKSRMSAPSGCRMERGRPGPRVAAQ